MKKERNAIIAKKVNTIIADEEKANVFVDRMTSALSTKMPLKMREMFHEQGFSMRNGDYFDGLVLAMVGKAMRGDVSAFTVIRDTMGYKPVDQVVNDTKITIEMSPQAKALGE